MKLSGFSGTGTGKLGASVFVVRNGEQIVRQYQPIVLNPKSTAQAAQRAKLKLASQLSAVLSNHIVPFKESADRGQSARNVFVKALFNSGAMSYNNNSAAADLTKVKLTPSNVDAMNVVSGGIVVDGLNTTITVRPFVDFKENASLVGVILRSNETDGVEVIGYGKTDILANETNTNLTITTSINAIPGDIVLLYIAKVDNAKLPTIYRDMYAGSSTSAMLDVVQREVQYALIYSKTINETIPQQG